MTNFGQPLKINSTLILYQSTSNITQQGTGNVSLGQDNLFSYSFVSNLNGSITISLQWSHIYPADVHGTFNAFDGEITGHIDPISLVFPEHSPLTPSCGELKSLNATFESLGTKISEALASCNLNPSSTSIPYKRSTWSSGSKSLVARQIGGDPGHVTDTGAAPICQACVLAAENALNVVAICLPACVDPFTSWFTCPQCVNAVNNEINMLINDCYMGSLCCPRACGPGPRPSGCCAASESCLDNTGLCCSAGMSPIVSSSSGDVCYLPVDACNTECCNYFGPGVPSLITQFCADYANSLCCYEGEQAVNGICCSPNEINCGGNCCPGSCFAGVCHTTDASCMAIGAHSACTPPETCPPNYSCADGCCFQSMNIP